MNASPQRPRAHWFAMLGILAILGSTLGCAGGQEVTPEAIEAAKRLWTQASIRDYDLEWSTSGSNNARYFVTVHGGLVDKVELIQPDGSRVKGTGEARFYGVDGLFLTIADELAQLKKDRPFDQPPGTKFVMRFKTDSKLGYPHWYRRDVMGTSRGVRIDVIRLVPTAPTSIPLEAEK
jgi:hypothetical protein